LQVKKPFAIATLLESRRSIVSRIRRAASDFPEIFLRPPDATRTVRRL